MVGRVLVLLYINDLLYQVKAIVCQFADDTIIYTFSDNPDQIMADFRCLEQWEKDWSMEFHPAKCEYCTSDSVAKDQITTALLHAAPRTNSPKPRPLGT